ncbi:hypothetical protein [Actinoplanes lobatus]|uniref:Uncharacterized protein n=1 Tax=Actinoplanes lobatus TaxID=113568 RepID=A0A7W7HRD6_9ACTN|nr:hypothetical protein [Actinoplanes lobatus]MBB4755318.1 hypothetical protein [Actinoplanes lobatus]GIE46185.1 hypothetical protein Alo02nite_90830 [Actinoplanes lobatus]
MARIRTIKPEFWSSPAMEGLDPWTRLLFIALWNWADDSGRGTAEPRALAGFAFPNDEDITSADIRRMLGEIRRAFGVIFYEVGGRRFYCIPSWDRHQKIDKRSAPRYPGPEDGEPFDPDPNGPSRNTAEQEKPAPLGETRRVPAESPPSPRRKPGAGSGKLEVGTGEQVNYPALASLDAEAAEPDAAAPEPGAVELFVVTEADMVVPPENAGQLTKQWIDYCEANNLKLTSTAIKRYGRHIKSALAQGFEIGHIKTALAQMLRDRVASRPALLDNYLIRTQQGPEMPPERMSRHQADAERRAPEGSTAAQQLYDTLTRPA